MTVIGFTGTRQGMTRLQKQLVETLLVMHNPKEAHHGDCVGSDAQFHRIICDKTESSIIVHPPTDPKYRAFCAADETRGDMILPAKPYLDRNQAIVDYSSIMIATPRLLREEQCSGTWYTVRYARKVGREIHIIYPDGSTTHEEKR